MFFFFFFFFQAEDGIRGGRVTGVQTCALPIFAGGHGGGFALGEWLAAVRAQARAAVLIGASADELAGLLAGHAVRRAATLEGAVEAAAELAVPGDVVLLSPAYKSFDMFASYEDRGRRFKAAVRALHGA